MQADPFEQFEIHRWLPFEIGGFDASFTNTSAFMVLTVVLTTVFLSLGMRRGALVPGRWQSMAELTYEFVANMLNQTVGPDGRRYFPFVFTLFMFVLMANLLGMVPLGHVGFTVTSHIIVTFGLAAVVFLGVTLIGFMRHGLGYLKLFVPAGVPALLLVLLIPIELISYLIRPITLSVRLFANMMAGHTLLKVIAGFVGVLGIWGVFPVVVLVGLTALELLVAVLQAYIFAILTCIYLKDAIHMHH